MKQSYHTKLAGVTKLNDCGEDIQYLLECLCDDYFEGDPLELEHEKNNPNDPNAIKVYHNGDHIGYIKAELAEELAPLVDQGKVEAELSAITGGHDAKSYGCNILVRVLPLGKVVISAPRFASASIISSVSMASSSIDKKSESNHYVNHTYDKNRSRYGKSTAKKDIEPKDPTVFDKIIPMGSVREKLLLTSIFLITFVGTILLLFTFFG